MPTYEYACKSCGHMFEIVQSMSDEPLTACPECGGELRKVFAPPAIAFKGSGFYATDHGKKSKKPAEKSSEGAGDKPAATAGGKDTPKPADKRAAAGSPSPAGSSSSGSSS